MTRIDLIKRVERLILYGERIKTALQKRDRREHQNALADIAEASEIARRLYDALFKFLK